MSHATSYLSIDFAQKYKDFLAASKDARANACDIHRESEALALIDGGVDNEGTAHIYITGILDECDPCVAIWCGVTAPSRVASVLERYRADPEAKQIWLIFNSPGGNTAGIHSLSNLIANFPKPVHAVVTNQCCSAAYWLASQCATISANPEAIIGAIGVFALLWDSSEELAKRGLKTTLLASGKLKGAGCPGQPYTEEQLENEQAIVNDLFTLFRAAITSKRQPAQEVFDGGAYVATRAANLGLVDIIV